MVNIAVRLNIAKVGLYKVSLYKVSFTKIDCLKGQLLAKPVLQSKNGQLLQLAVLIVY